MATDVERLAVLIEANTKSYERAMTRFQRTTDNAARRVEQRHVAAGRKLDAVFGDVGRSAMRLAGTLGIAFGTAQTIRAIGQATQEYINLRNALKVVGLEGEKLEDIQARLFAIAQKNGAELKPLAVLYGRQKQVQNELRASDEELLKFTEGVSLALRVQGSSAEQSRGALLQLSQALASGTVRAEEFNSINEGALPILQTVARGLEEAGGSVGKLKLLVNDGKVSSEAFFRAFLAGSGQLQEQADKMQGTVGQATNRMANAFTLFVGKLDETIGASGNAADNINKVAGAIDKLPAVIESAAGGLDSLKSKLNEFGNLPFWGQMNEWLRARGLLASEADQQRQFRGLQGIETPTGPGGRIAEGAASSRGQFVAEASGTVSITDFAAAGKDKKGKSDPFETALQSAEKRIALLNAETGAIGLNAAARERARIKAELETAAKNANSAAGMTNTEVTAAQRIKINETADAMAAAKARNEELTQSLEAQQEVLQFAGDQTIDLLKTLSGTAEDRARALTNVVNTLLDAMLKASLLGQGPLAKLLGFANPAGGIGGLFGALFGGLFGGFRAGGGDVMSGRSYVVGERGPELFVPRTSGRVVPNGAAAGGAAAGTTINNWTVNAPGATPEAMALAFNEIDRINRTFEGRAVNAIASARTLRPGSVGGC